MRVARPVIPAPRRHRQEDLSYILMEGGIKQGGEGEEGGERKHERKEERDRQTKRENSFFLDLLI